MHKFKVGDKVKLKIMSQYQFDKCDTGAGMLSSMIKFTGEVHTVIRAPKVGNLLLSNPAGYEYYYSPNWIEPAVKFKGNK